MGINNFILIISPSKLEQAFWQGYAGGNEEKAGVTLAKSLITGYLLHPIHIAEGQIHPSTWQMVCAQ